MQHYRYGTQIKIKIDTCIDCGRVRKIHSLKRCDYCYKIHNQKARQDRVRERNPQLVEEQKLQWEWYEGKIRNQKGRCEECGDRIVHKEKKYEHWSVCHILPKEFFKSIKVHQENSIELCNTCHTLYDNYLQNHDERLMHMRIYHVIIEKIKILKPFISEHRKFNNLPEFILKQII